MKVSIVVGGRWHAFDLARELQAAGVLHRLITTYPKFKTRQWAIADDKVVSLPLKLLLEKTVYLLGGEPMTTRCQAILHHLFSAAAARYLEGSTVIHGWSSFSEPSLLWAKKQGIPFVLERSSAHITVQCQLLREEYNRLGLHWHETHPRIVEQELREYDLADRIAVPSLFVKRGFLAQGFLENRLIHNPFGTNLDNFSPGSRSDSIFRVIYAGSLSVRKGIGYLVQGFQQANIAHSELLLVGGPTKETSHLLGEADIRVKCLGHVPQTELMNYYQNSSVFVMPSIEEGLAMVQTQALACGLPLICTTNTGGEDLLKMSKVDPIQREKHIQEFPAGYLIPVRNSAALANCLTLLAQDQHLQNLKKKAALALRSSSLNWQTYAERALASYRLLEKKGD